MACRRRDRALLGRGDALLQVAHLGGQRRLVAHRRGHATQQGRYLRARLREAEDVVDEQEDVASLLVAEVLGHGQRREAHPLAGARRLVHLAEDHDGLRQDARLGHLAQEVVPLARALAHAGEDGVAAVLLGDVADQLLDDDRLAHAGAAEDADLAAALERGDQVDDLDAGLEDLRLGLHLVEGRRVPMDWQHLLRLDGAGLPSIGWPSTSNTRPSVASPTGTVIGPPVSVASRPRDRPSVVDMATVRTQLLPRCCCTSTTSVSSRALTELFPAFGRLAAVAIGRGRAARRLGTLDLERVVDGGQVARRELDVDHGSRDLDHLSGCHRVLSVLLVLSRRALQRRRRSRSFRG